MISPDDVKANIKKLSEIKNQLGGFLQIFIQNVI